MLIFYALIAALSGYIILKLSYKKNTVSPYKKYAQYIPDSYRLGFTNLDHEISVENLEITGKIPQWLSGTLLRNGPAKFTTQDSFVSNWFDGLAMLHAFSFDNGKVSYANKFLKTYDYDFVKKTGKMTYIGFRQDPCATIFNKFLSLFIPNPASYGTLPNANVNIERYTNKFIALTETPLPVEFDPKTLETLGALDYQDNYPKANIEESVHPHYDFNTKEHTSYLINFSFNSKYVIYNIKDNSFKREPIIEIGIEEPSYIHSFSITDKYIILITQPLVVNPLKLFISDKGFINNFKWKPRLGTKFIVIDKENKIVINTYKTKAFFFFHTVNAYQEENNLIIDIVKYKDSSVIDDADFDKILSNKNIVNIHNTPKLSRFTISLDTNKIEEQILYENIIELPRINYQNNNGKNYNYIYAAGKKEQGYNYTFDQLVKINVKTGEVKYWHQQDCYPGEPVFIQTPKQDSNEPKSTEQSNSHDPKALEIDNLNNLNNNIITNEDDGIITSVVLDIKAGRSFLLILDAKTFQEIGQAHLPHHIPFGIHGNYFIN